MSVRRSVGGQPAPDQSIAPSRMANGIIPGISVCPQEEIWLSSCMTEIKIVLKIINFGEVLYRNEYPVVYTAGYTAVVS